MSLIRLLDNQTIKIDDHKRGSKEVKDWDKSDVDIHIHKRMQYKIDGKYQRVEILIPINSSQRPITFKKGKVQQDINKQLFEEIQSVLLSNDEEVRKFAESLAKELKNYSSILDNVEKTKKALERLSKHFDLKWSDKEVASYANDKLVAYTQVYEHEDEKKYFGTVDKDGIEFGMVNPNTIHRIGLLKI